MVDISIIKITYFTQVDSEGSDNLGKKFFSKHNPVASSSFINMRETTGRYRLAPGEYMIVPSTFDQGEEAEFLLRIYSEKEADLLYVFVLCLAVNIF